MCIRDRLYSIHTKFSNIISGLEVEEMHFIISRQRDFPLHNCIYEISLMYTTSIFIAYRTEQYLLGNKKHIQFAMSPFPRICLSFLFFLVRAASSLFVPFSWRISLNSHFTMYDNRQISVNKGGDFFLGTMFFQALVDSQFPRFLPQRRNLLAFERSIAEQHLKDLVGQYHFSKLEVLIVRLSSIVVSNLGVRRIEFCVLFEFCGTFSPEKDSGVQGTLKDFHFQPGYSFVVGFLILIKLTVLARRSVLVDSLMQEG
eukprot:TRINITY_DN2826_c0_g1_i10.p1 TRINITY_DN2826_c0_g1~~TRINITY_DN2826_c0_g1_i10.p1  ORF type:complete len:283 (-),score=11.39 TRINITY_DN2826_c0_g1_i10:466-1236(-)